MRIRFKGAHLAPAIGGVSLLYGWLFLCIYAVVQNHTSIDEFYISRQAMAVGFLAITAFSVFFIRFISPAIRRPLAPLMVLAVIGLFLAVYSDLALSASLFLLILGSACIGLEFGWLSLIWSEFYGLMDTFHAGVCFAFSCVFAVLLFIGVTLLPLLPLVIVTSLLPIASLLVLRFGLRALERTSDKDLPELHIEKTLSSSGFQIPWHRSELFSILKYAIVTLGIYDIIFSFMNMYYGIIRYETIWISGGVGVLLFALLILIPPRLSLRRLYRIAQPVTILGLLLLPFAPSVGNALITLGFMTILGSLILTLSEAGYRFKTSVVRLAGFSFMIAIIGCSIGMTAAWALSSFVPSDTFMQVCLNGVLIMFLLIYTASIPTDGGFVFEPSSKEIQDDVSFATTSEKASSSKSPASKLALYEAIFVFKSSDEDIASNGNSKAANEEATSSDLRTSKLAFYEAINARCAYIAQNFRLSVREEEVLVLIMQGHSIQTIANKLFLSQSTVKTHIHNIYVKLEISNRDELQKLVKLD